MAILVVVAVLVAVLVVWKWQALRTWWHQKPRSSSGSTKAAAAVQVPSALARYRPRPSAHPTGEQRVFRTNKGWRVYQVGIEGGREVPIVKGRPERSDERTERTERHHEREPREREPHRHRRHHRQK